VKNITHSYVSLRAKAISCCNFMGRFVTLTMTVSAMGLLRRFTPCNDRRWCLFKRWYPCCNW